MVAFWFNAMEEGTVIERKMSQFVVTVVHPFLPKAVTLQISSSIYATITHNCMQI